VRVRVRVRDRDLRDLRDPKEGTAPHREPCTVHRAPCTVNREPCTVPVHRPADIFLERSGRDGQHTDTSQQPDNPCSRHARASISRHLPPPFSQNSRPRRRGDPLVHHAARPGSQRRRARRRHRHRGSGQRARRPSLERHQGLPVRGCLRRRLQRFRAQQGDRGRARHQRPDVHRLPQDCWKTRTSMQSSSPPPTICTR
jgi:hypothetical protein